MKRRSLRQLVYEDILNRREEETHSRAGETYGKQALLKFGLHNILKQYGRDITELSHMLNKRSSKIFSTCRANDLAICINSFMRNPGYDQARLPKPSYLQ